MEQLQVIHEQTAPQTYRSEAQAESGLETAGDSTLARWVVSESRRKRRNILRGVTGLLTSWAMLYVFLWLFENVGLNQGWMLPEGVIGPFLFASFLGSMALCAYFSLPSHRQQESLRELARCTDVSVIGPLVDMIREIQPRHTRTALRKTLAALAPRLKESDILLLTTSQRRKLHHLLHDAIIYDRDPAFAISLLKGLEQIGDEQTARAIGKAMTMAGRGEKWKRLRAAADDALAVINARLSRRKSPSVLLRPAEAVDADTNLLRPAGENGARTAESLLRAAASNTTTDSD